MRKLLLISAIALACASLSFADAFAGLAFEAELDGPAMAAIDGQMFTIFVPFNSVGTATVITRDRGDYCQFTVPVTTFACSNASNPPTNAKKEYVPTPLPVGNYNLGATRAMSNTDCGVGIAIKATVATPYVNGGSYQAGDYFVHSTSSSFTWGCVGVQGGTGTNANMAKVLNAYTTSTGTKSIRVR